MNYWNYQNRTRNDSYKTPQILTLKSQSKRSPHLNLGHFEKLVKSQLLTFNSF